MKYLARCPGCRVRFPRSDYFKTMPHVRRICKHCGCLYEVNPIWEWVGDAAFALIGLIPITLAFFDRLSWWIAIATLGVLMLIGLVLYPYVTPYRLIYTPNYQDLTGDET